MVKTLIVRYCSFVNGIRVAVDRNTNLSVSCGLVNYPFIAVQLPTCETRCNILGAAVHAFLIEMERQINCVRYGTKRFRVTKRSLRRILTRKCVRSAPDRGPVESFDVYHLLEITRKVRNVQILRTSTTTAVTTEAGRDAPWFVNHSIQRATALR